MVVDTEVIKSVPRIILTPKIHYHFKCPKYNEKEVRPKNNCEFVEPKK